MKKKKNYKNKYRNLKGKKRKTYLKENPKFKYAKSKNYYSISIKMVIIFIFILCFHILSSGSFQLKQRQIIFDKIIEFEKNLKNITEEEVQEFRRINSDNILLEQTNYKKPDNPEISVIITSRNQAHCIHKCLRSVQNQSIKNIEIILIDDCSLDNSTEIIEEYQKNDARITLLKHDINWGTIKSRTDGIRLAKGKYITIIDGDDSLIHKDALYNALYIAKLGDIDIVELKFAYYKKHIFRTIVNSYELLNLNEVIYQPELRTKFFIINGTDSVRAVQNRNICAKLVKNEVFQQAIVNIGPKYTNDSISKYEDVIHAVAILQVAKSYYLMKEVGYYYSRDESEGRFPILKEKQCKKNPNKIGDMGHIKLLKFLFEKTANNQLERQMLYHELFSINHYLSLVYITHHDYELVYEVLDAMIANEFYNSTQKERLITLKNRLLKKQNKALI